LFLEVLGVKIIEYDVHYFALAGSFINNGQH